MTILFLAGDSWSAEVQWAEPFVIRTGETVTLTVRGHALPQVAKVAVLFEGKVDKTIAVLDWERQSPRTARLMLDIRADTPAGVRGIDLQIERGNNLRQNVAFRVAEAERLPWPHESPNLGPRKREDLRDKVFVINNFGLYQGSPTDRSQNYFHDGLDIVLPRGTPIFALADGVVRDIFLSSNVGSRSIAVEDLKNPGFGWIYVHTDGFKHSVGNIVRRGERIAEVAAFNGLEHIHLSRTFVSEGRRWNRISSHSNIFADDFFDVRDAERPVIQKRLFLFRNESNELLPASDGRPFASGNVDIVIGIRDRGHYARSKDPNFPAGVGDRLALAVVRCDILNSSGERVAQWTRDMTRSVLRWTDDQTSIWAPDRVAVVFKSPLDIPGSQQGGQFFSYYVITNSAGINPIGEITPSDTEYSWKTAAINRKGERIFPDGLYTIRITAWDSAGNRSTYRRRVQVRNEPL